MQNCTQLAGFYLGEGFTDCGHYLLSAARALQKKVQSEGVTIAEEVVANVALGWAKFYLDRLSVSAAQFENQEEVPRKQAGWQIPEHLQ